VKAPRALRSLALVGSLLVAAAAAALPACSTTSATPAGADAGAEAEAESYPETYQDAEPQRAGDPTKGYDALVNNGYVPCGIPYSAFAQVYGPAPETMRVPGRTGRNAELPYNFTSMKAKSGVEIITSNCLTCHAGRIQGKLVVGLGSNDGDFTTSAQATTQQAEGVGILLSDPTEREEWRKWADRVETIAPYSELDTVGPNPADSFTAVLFAHHDPKTMAWSKVPLIELPPKVVVPVDVPPWWRMKKKASMFYVGAGRGDHARIMMAASILCTSSVEESKEIDAYFGDIRAWIASLDAPAYPFPIDRPLAQQGQAVFEKTCTRCHGTYGAGGKYPNRVVSLPEVKTDPLLASGSSEFAGPYVEWFKNSFFGETARFEPQMGYVAPPLDGIWATAPYLHNGSVPTIAALLDSTARPTYWTRTFDSNDFDEAALGWKFTEVDHGKDGETSQAKKKKLYDTSRPGYSNAGHTFGDTLTADERKAVVEYLKTL
jgi:mono/diheme cytochrome c family protein